MDIAYICIATSNLEESVLFYRDIIGLKEDLLRSEENFHALKAGNTYIGIERKGVKKDGQKTKAENSVLIQFKALKSISAHYQSSVAPLRAVLLRQS